MTTLEIILIVALIYLVIAIILIGVNSCCIGLVELADIFVCLAWGVTIWIVIIQAIQRKIQRKIKEKRGK